MPFGRRKADDGGAQEGPAASLRASDALVRPPTVLTKELLDWALSAVEAVLSTHQVKALAPGRTRQAITEGYKFLDRLYPLTAEVRSDAVLYELETRDTGVSRERDHEASARLATHGSESDSIDPTHD